MVFVGVEKREKKEKIEIRVFIALGLVCKLAFYIATLKL